MIVLLFVLFCVCDADTSRIYAGVCGASSVKGSNTKPKKQCVGGGAYPCDRVSGSKPCCNNTACSGGANAKVGDFFACISCEGPNTISQCVVGAVFSCSSTSFTATQPIVSVGYSPNSIIEGSDSVLTIAVRNVFPVLRGDSKRKRTPAKLLKQTEKEVNHGATRGRSRRASMSSSTSRRSESVASTTPRGLAFSLLPIELPSFQEIGAAAVTSNTCTNISVIAEVGSSSISFAGDAAVETSCAISIAITTVSGGFSATSVSASYTVPTTTVTTFASADATLFTAPCVEGPSSTGEPTETHDAPVSTSSSAFSPFIAERGTLCSAKILYHAAAAAPQILTVSVYESRPQVNVSQVPPTLTIQPIATAVVTVEGSNCLIGGSTTCTVVAKFSPKLATTPSHQYFLGLSTTDAATSGIWLGVDNQAKKKDIVTIPFWSDVFDAGAFSNVTSTDQPLDLIQDTTTRLLFSIFGA